MIAEDKGDYGGTIYKKTLVSDNQAERVYSAEINDFYEVSSLATETFDKQKQIWHCEGEWFANRVSKNTETRFPPKSVYLSESKMKAKKIIFTALAVLFQIALSSLAFAKPYGEKSRADSVGDIVFEKMKKKACLAKICSLLQLALVPAFAEFDDDILIQ